MRAGRLLRIRILLSFTALGFSACAERAAREPPSTTTDPGPWCELPEFRMLADAGTFEASAVGVAGDTPLSAVAFTRLVLRDDAPAVFEDLLRQEDLAARLYGLQGLWFADRARHRQAAEELAKLDADVPVLIGCIGGKESLRSLAGQAQVVESGISPVALFHAGIEWLQEADPRTIDAGGWRKTLLDPDQPEGHRLWAARALSYSLEGPGLDALLGSLPALDAEMRDKVLELLD